VLGVDYQQVIPLLVNELQRQQQELAALKAERQQELALLRAQQESLRAELLQIRAVRAPRTAALR
jgi:septal ring factor EnvC (AmiA/AmiB activator)